MSFKILYCKGTKVQKVCEEAPLSQSEILSFIMYKKKELRSNAAGLESWNLKFLSGLQFGPRVMLFFFFNCPKDVIMSYFCDICQDRIDVFCLLLSENSDFLSRFWLQGTTEPLTAAGGGIIIVYTSPVVVSFLRITTSFITQGLGSKSERGRTSMSLFYR